MTSTLSWVLVEITHSPPRRNAPIAALLCPQYCNPTLNISSMDNLFLHHRHIHTISQNVSAYIYLFVTNLRVRKPVHTLISNMPITDYVFTREDCAKNIYSRRQGFIQGRVKKTFRTVITNCTVLPGPFLYRRLTVAVNVQN